VNASRIVGLRARVEAHEHAEGDRETDSERVDDPSRHCVDYGGERVGRIY
jgi:hypothetical protein